MSSKADVTILSKSNLHLEICEFAYESIASGISKQKEDLRSLRNQASIVSAVNGLLVTFLSTLVFEVFRLQKIDAEAADFNLFLNLNFQTLIALICFIGSLGLAARIMLPSPGWTFDLDNASIIENFAYSKSKVRMGDFYEKLTRQRQKHFNANEILLGKIQNELFYSIVLAIFQIPFWLFNLIQL